MSKVLNKYITVLDYADKIFLVCQARVGAFLFPHWLLLAVVPLV